MTTEKLFRILSAILLPIIFFLAFIILFFLFFSFSNPMMLFGIFVFACVVLYMVKSTQFLRRNIMTGLPAKASARDWIRVNAFVSIFFVIEIIANAVYLFTHHKEVATTMQAMLNRMQDAQGTAAMPIDGAQMFGALKNMMICFLVLDVMLAVHIFCCFKLLKRYRGLFVQSH